MTVFTNRDTIVTSKFESSKHKRRVKTYIEGYDNLIGGGIPQHTVTLISGATGTLKTVLSYSILYNNAKRGIVGLYLTLDQRKLSLLRQVDTMGMRADDVKGRLHIFELDEFVTYAHSNKGGNESTHPRIDIDLEPFVTALQNLKKKLNFSLLAIDTFSSLEPLINIDGFREGIGGFYETLRTNELTTFLVFEPTVSSDFRGDVFTKFNFDEAYLADGIFLLTITPTGETNYQRQLYCIKLRESVHTLEPKSISFDHGKFKILS